MTQIQQHIKTYPVSVHPRLPVDTQRCGPPHASNINKHSDQASGQTEGLKPGHPL